MGQIDGKFVPFPTHDELEDSDLDLIVSGNKEAVLMIEGFAREMPEDRMAEAITRSLLDHRGYNPLRPHPARDRSHRDKTDDSVEDVAASVCYRARSHGSRALRARTPSRSVGTGRPRAAGERPSACRF